MKNLELLGIKDEISWMPGHSDINPIILKIAKSYTVLAFLSAIGLRGMGMWISWQ